jgi:cytochrome c
MKRNIITVSAFGLLSLCIYSCNNQDSPSNTTTEQTTEVKTADTANSGGKTDTLTVQPEAPKVVEEEKKKVDSGLVKAKLKPPVVKKDQPKADAIDQAAIDEGKELIAKSDCLACHKLQDKLVGPSYSDVAAKYSYSKSTVQNLAGKVISGGTGVWGQVPMTPHPNITPENAQKMVTYILSLKK